MQSSSTIGYIILAGLPFPGGRENLRTYSKVDICTCWTCRSLLGIFTPAEFLLLVNSHYCHYPPPKKIGESSTR